MFRHGSTDVLTCTEKKWDRYVVKEPKKVKRAKRKKIEKGQNILTIVRKKFCKMDVMKNNMGLVFHEGLFF